ncbi:Protein RESTRICTED TEV MOVEMENT like [Actinidia chinensis var. chinensis]|uniref:Protein RESTRICTED TEV MOVEMENT like n=1 Tax=Actinidia chinensis var. chinensis TaxID=1590841 RepID=A0A2R6QTU5_ACTCC|nr:Protein RESTRICTED TEV MOVEMENT like [Actinidia chinensis var. chinensis]
MDQKLVAAGREYVDFEPNTDLAQEEDCVTLLVHLPDFKKEQLRIQLTPTRTLKIIGERILADNKWIRLQKEYPVSTNYDINRITAKLEGGILYIRQPKLVTSSVKQDLKEKPTATSNETQKKPENGQPQGPQPQKTAETTTTADQSKQMTEEKGGELKEDENVAKEEGRSNGVDEFGEGTEGTMSDDRERGVSGSGRAEGEKKVPGMLMNLLLGILLAMVLGIYFRNWIKSDKE